MGLRIQLLGSPKIERDGVSVDAPRGYKTWGLLTYLVRTRVPSSRERLANLLFPEAGDPLGSLRWTLSVLRRQLGEHAEARRRSAAAYPVAWYLPRPRGPGPRILGPSHRATRSRPRPPRR